MTACIIDLSALYWRHWHASKGDSIGGAAQKCIDFVRKQKQQFKSVYVALDKPPYERKKMYPQYKDGREHEPAAVGELSKAVEQIRKEGVHVAYCQGWEADDVIATLLHDEDYQLRRGPATVFASDKDLLQCADITCPFTGKTTDAKTKLGVGVEAVVDYLALVGDSADNIKGVPSVGDKTARALLEKFNNIHGIYTALENSPELFTKKAVRAGLLEARTWIDDNVELITLRDDLNLTIDKQEVEVPDMTQDADFEEAEEKEVTEDEPKQVAIEKVKVAHDQLTFKQSLEPMGIAECRTVAKWLYESRLYEKKFHYPQAIMAIMMRGRELGIGATTALDQMDMIQGKPTMSAALMVGLVKSRKDVCEYIQCTERTNERCTWITKRVGNPQETKYTFTIEDAQRMGLTNKDNWKKQPATMIQWRGVAGIIRQEYPDVINGLYASEEME